MNKPFIALVNSVEDNQLDSVEIPYYRVQNISEINTLNHFKKNMRRGYRNSR